MLHGDETAYFFFFLNYPMALSFHTTLQEALSAIQFTGGYKEFIVHDKESLADHSSVLIDRYGNAKWDVIDTLNATYGSQLPFPIDLTHWLHHEEHDEVAYFLCEAGSNALHNSEFKSPSHFAIWFGKKGFIIAVAQKGEGFNAKEIHSTKRKEIEGAAFLFYETCTQTVFFDDSTDARCVYFQVML